MRTAFVVCGSIAALVLAACGGDDKPSKAEYIREADAICARGDRELETAARRQFGNREPSGQQLEQFATSTVVPKIENQIEQLRELEKPEGDEDELNEIYDLAEQANNRLAANPSLLAGGADPFAEANARAKAYGFKSCGE